MNTASLNGKSTAMQALRATRHPVELVALGGLTLFYSLIYTFKVINLYWLANLVGPLALFITLSWISYLTVRNNTLNLWAPILWFRLTSAAFFGFGALVPLIVNSQTESYMAVAYRLDDAISLKINLIYCLGVFGTLLMYNVFTTFMRADELDAGYSTIESKRSTLKYAVIYLLAGALLRYMVVIPYTFGGVGFVLPGAIITLSLVYYVGVYLIVVYCINYDRRLIGLVISIITVDLLVSVATFSKSALILLLIFSFFGFLSNGATAKKLITGLVCVLVAYFSFQPLVGYGRNELNYRYGSASSAGIGERLSIARDYLNGGNESDASGIQWGLLRLSYMNVSAFVVNKYDIGQPGYTFSDALTVFVPRALWPDKPIITRLSTDLNYNIYGTETSSVAPGHSSEAYWNFGWLGIPPYMALLAFILASFTRISLTIMARKNWLYLPVVFIGVQVGLRVDGFFVPDTLGGTAMAVALGVGLWLFQRGVSSGPRGSGRSHFGGRLGG